MTARYFIDAIKYMYESSITINVDAVVPLCVLSSQLRLRGSVCSELKQRAFEDYLTVDHCLLFLKQANELNYGSLAYECCQYTLVHLLQVPSHHWEVYLSQWKDFKTLLLFALRQESDAIYYGGQLIIVYIKQLSVGNKSKATTALLELNNIEQLTKLTIGHALIVLSICDSLFEEKKALDQFELLKVIYSRLQEICTNITSKKKDYFCFVCSCCKIYRIAVQTVAAHFPLDVNDSLWKQVSAMSVDTLELILSYTMHQSHANEKVGMFKLINNCEDQQHVDLLYNEMSQGDSFSQNYLLFKEDDDTTKNILRSDSPSGNTIHPAVVNSLKNISSSENCTLQSNFVANACNRDGTPVPYYESLRANDGSDQDFECDRKLAHTPELSRLAKNHLLNNGRFNTADSRFSLLLEQTSPDKHSDSSKCIDNKSFHTDTRNESQLYYLSRSPQSQSNVSKSDGVDVNNKALSPVRQPDAQKKDEFKTPIRAKSKEETQATPTQDLSQSKNFLLSNKAQYLQDESTKLLLQVPLVDDESGIIALCEAPMAKIRPRPESSTQFEPTDKKIPKSCNSSPTCNMFAALNVENIGISMISPNHNGATVQEIIVDVNIALVSVAQIHAQALMNCHHAKSAQLVLTFKGIINENKNSPIKLELLHEIMTKNKYLKNAQHFFG
ncbi:hypothetical protein RFI_24731 [Reticulomyxa filosa]|uniref:Uncharacterized protein n=1 Tax=Reticulomyxa filosa TaxID=46433 RepID=X6MFG2_RETFI|nr:hypothetical protein RFI_24731 [Reticulomyxa filosa]|eukprot:ETO12644.1 hypothetical protein RFI_24731 [Reticulomyxa filosa]